MTPLGNNSKKLARSFLSETFLHRNYEKIKAKYRKKLRNKAIDRARTRIYLHGRRPEDFEEDVLEVIVKEEEDKLIGEYKSKGLVTLIAALGLSLFS